MHYVKQKAAYYDGDYRNCLKISAAMKYMQQTSSEHLQALGLPYKKLYAEDMVFLLSKTCIKVHRMPEVGQEINIGTAPTGARGARFVREFVIEDMQGERLLSALTLWVLVNPHTRKILRPAGFPYMLPFQPPLVTDVVDDMRMPKPIEDENTRFTDIPIGYSHIDCNGHVNNSKYADFVCDALPYEQLMQQGIDTLVISYQNEAKWGDVVRMHTTFLSPFEYYIGASHNDAACFEAYVRMQDLSLAHCME